MTSPVPVVMTVLAAALALLPGCRPVPVEPPRQLTLAHLQPAGQPSHAGLLRLAELLGRTHPAPLVLNFVGARPQARESDLVTAVQAGATDLALVSAQALESLVPEMAVFSLPYLFDDADHFHRVLDSPVGGGILDRLEKANLKGLAFYEAGSRGIYANRPIIGATSLAGLRVAVPPDAGGASQALAALGAVPRPTPWHQVGDQLQPGGTLDAGLGSIPAYVAAGHHRPAPYYYDDQQTFLAQVLVMNLQAWHRLSAREKLAVEPAALESARHQRDLWALAVLRDTAVAEKQGAIIARKVDRQVLRERVQVIYDALPAPLRGLVESIDALRIARRAD